MTTAIAKTDLVHNLSDLMTLADTLVKSRLIPAAIATKEAAAVIILQGRELGIGPMQAFAGISVIQNKPAVGPQLMLALINRTGLLDDLSIEDDGDTCAVTMTRSGRKPYTATFSMKNAGAMGLAGKDNYKKQPAVMRKWRAVAACARVVFPDAIAGMYTPEELGADVNDEGEVVEGQATDIPPEAPEWQAQLTGLTVTVPVEAPPTVTQTTPVARVAGANGGNGPLATPGNRDRPYPPEVLRTGLAHAVKKHGSAPASQAQRGLLVGVLEACFLGEHATAKRHSVTKYLTGHDSLALEHGAPGGAVLALLDWMKPTRDSGGAYLADAMATREAGLVLRQAMVEAGQTEMELSPPAPA